ncbi:MAG: ADP-ribose pyrophosphatase [Candidatus Falkowbacteria bacterium GW2011_GWF2_43_32]|nr:MAG: ADP-ribose pyrophosphatase [Candidatus Falkowbacteria bacterium GW2011_GWF2_43_32]
MNEEIKAHPEAVVGPIIYNEKGEILLIKNPKFGDFWTIPGGHIELDEPAEEALKREIMEETGLELKNIEPIGFTEGINPEFFHKKKHFIYLNYLAELAGGEMTKSEEMTEYLWIAPEKTGDLKISESVRPLIDIYLEKKKNDAICQPADWEHKYKRALADYQNLVKQTAKDREEFVKYAIGDFLQDIIPVYDHLKMSLTGIDEEIDKNPWAVGVRHVLKQFKDILTSRGVEEIKTAGEKFDHNLMEAVDGTGEKVKQELMPGYTLNGRVIRAAKVIVE